MLYISDGYLPNSLPHTVQTAKMSQAFAQKIPDFELVTTGDMITFFRGMDGFFKSWYGLEGSFKLTRLPLGLKFDYPLPPDYPKGFLKLALLYACFKQPSFIYTRTTSVAEGALRLGFPVFWEWHEPLKDHLPYINYLQYENLLGVVTTLDSIAQTFLYYGLPEDKLLIAPNAADLNNLLPYQTQQEARLKLSLPLEQTLILYSGSLYDYKGIPTVLKLAEMLPQSQFIFVGGPEKQIDRIRQKSIENNLQNITLVGHIPQNHLATYLYSADILLLPTSPTWELAGYTCPLKLFDYMTVKRPIIASALPTIETIAKHRVNSLLAEPDNPESFYQNIIELLHNPQLKENITTQAFEEVQTLTWDNRASQILAFIEKRLTATNWVKLDRRTYLKNYFSMLGKQ